MRTGEDTRKEKQGKQKKIRQLVRPPHLLRTEGPVLRAIGRHSGLRRKASRDEGANITANNMCFFARRLRRIAARSARVETASDNLRIEQVAK